VRDSAADGIGAAYADEVTALAELGPFFAVAAHQAFSAHEMPAPHEVSPAHDVPAAQEVSAARPDGGPWRSMGELADGSGVLAARVAEVRALLAAGGGRPAEAVELRVAASVTHLGLAARIVSPYLALAVLYGRAPVGLRLADLRWQPALGGPYPLSLPCQGASGPTPPGQGEPSAAEAPARGPVPLAPSRSPGRRADPAGGLQALADGLARGLVEGPVRELVDACGALRVSPHVLWGNVASAVNGAAGMIAAVRPQDAARAHAIAGLLTDRSALRGTGVRTPAGAFRRRGCCLIYRAAPGGSGALCGDCALSRVPTRPA
jgi:FhuF 2Fe-2S C-terminal domain